MGRFFVSGIGTDVGKTFISAILVEALKADYWKPVQCGTAGGSDTEKLKQLVSNTDSIFHKESYLFSEPVSPHMAALNQNVKIKMDGFVLPHHNNHLIIEGAGGLMVPLNEDTYAIDLAREFEAEIILVCKSYLGCINHSLLSIDYLVKNDYPVKGIILNGNFEKAVRSAIINYSELPVLAEIPEVSEVTKDVVLNMAQTIDVAQFDD